VHRVERHQVASISTAIANGYRFEAPLSCRASDRGLTTLQGKDVHERGDRLVLHEVDELATFPSYPNVAEFLGADVRRGSCEMLPASMLHASDWYLEAVGLATGNYLPDWWSDDPVIDCQAVNLFRVRDAYYMPALGVVLTSSGEVLQSSLPRYRIPKLDVLPGATLEGNRTILAVPDEVPTLDAAIVSMPWSGRQNYGHFVLNCLPTLAHTGDVAQLAAYPRVFPELLPWHRRHLELLGITNPLELNEAVYRVSDLVLSSCMGGFLHHPNVSYRRVRDAQLAKRRVGGSVFEKIYVSRRGNVKRPLQSEARLEERLLDDGFVVVVPEQLSVDAQIEIFHAARLIVGCAGAAFANVLYCREAAVIVEITPSRMVENTPGRWVYYLCALLRCKWRPYFTSMINLDEDIEGRVAWPELGFSYDIDIDDFMDSIQRLTL
jgi:capsular polysaccharide biosynthesis protein